MELFPLIAVVSKSLQSKGNGSRSDWRQVVEMTPWTLVSVSVSASTGIHTATGCRTAPLQPDEWRCGQFGKLVLFAVLGTDLETERGEFGANKRDVVKQAGLQNADDLNV